MRASTIILHCFLSEMKATQSPDASELPLGYQGQRLCGEG
jgi:hypothetical protein